MALRTIRIMGDEVLTKTCREVTKVTPRISNLIDDMLEMMRAVLDWQHHRLACCAGS